MELERSSGVLAHPTSFPSRYGIGDLGKGAKDFVDFLIEGKQTLWQILPLNPTSFGDSPYQSFSTFAGNFLLISPDILAEKGYLQQSDLADAPNFSEDRVDYGEVISYKDKLFRTAHANFLKDASVKEKFNNFCSYNSIWLNDYCLFAAIKNHLINERKFELNSPALEDFCQKNKKYLDENELNDYYYGAAWVSWPTNLAKREPAALDECSKTLAQEVLYYKFLQFEFFEQWEELKKYANSFGIKIIGDIPIFVAMDSADVWANKELFQLDANGYPKSVAGVPPDYFSETGQLWGNPLYDWKEHKRTNYSWWTNRVGSLLSLVDFARIDHFRGFDSYWAIPYGEKTAINGKWVKGPGRDVFDKIEENLLGTKNKKSQLAIIAEDLGIITESVSALRNSLGFPGMKVLQFGFAGSFNLNMTFHFADSNCIIYTGTHDNDTTVGWYNAATEEEKDKFRRLLKVSGEDCSWDMIRFAFASIAVAAVVPVQDVLSLGSEARMNTPGISSNCWQFRYRSNQLTSALANGLNYLAELTDRNKKAALTDKKEEDKCLL